MLSELEHRTPVINQYYFLRLRKVPHQRRTFSSPAETNENVSATAATRPPGDVLTHFSCVTDSLEKGT
jgi:hypothetical protein